MTKGYRFLNVEFSRQEIQMIGKLLKTGLYGFSMEEVVERLIAEALLRLTQEGTNAKE